MLGKISIEFDFDQNSPFIKVIAASNSADLRDKALCRFFELLEHKSMWGKVEYQGETGSALLDTKYHEWKITPITPKDLSSQADLMKTVSQ